MYLNLVREIKTAITNSENLPPEFLVELANEYGRACNIVNEKLVDVSNLLKIGCRDEAVQVAEHPRSVLESVRELNFANRKDWLTVLSEKKMELPPRLDFHSAVKLEEAYEKLTELAPLLKKNRLLALAQAPLKSRILILKKLVEKDPDNQVWKLDLVNLQEARLRSMADEYRVALKQQDAERLGDLMEEVQGEWDVEVPSSLVKNISEALSSIGMESHLEKMGLVAKQLNQALVETDAQKGRQLRQRWMELNRVANLAGSDPMVKSLREPMRWLQELDQAHVADRNYNQAVADLEQSIAVGVPLEDLDKRVAHVDNFERDSSADLLNKAKAYRKSVIKEQRKQSQVTKYALIGAALAAVGLIGWFGFSQSRSVNLIEAQEQLRVMIQQKQYAEGVTTHDAFPDYIKEDSEVVGLYSQLTQFKQAEESRKGGMTKLLAEFNLEGDLGKELDDQLAQGRKMAKSPGEKEKITQLKEQLDACRLEKQKVRSAEFLEQLDPLAGELNSMLTKVNAGSAVPSAVMPIANKIRTLTKSSHADKEGLPGISSDAKAQADRLVASADGAMEREKLGKKSSEALSDLTKKVARINQLDDALLKFVARFSNEPNARDFEVSAREGQHFSGIRLWQDVGETVQQYPIETLSKDQLIDLQSDVTDALEMTDISHWGDSVKLLREHLDRVLAEDNNIDDEKGELESFFNQASHRSISVLERDGKKYYLLSDFDPDKRKFSYFVRGVNQRERKYQKGDIGGLAGHCKIASSVLQRLNRPSFDTDAQIIKMLENALVKSKPLSAINGPPIDPLVQCDMVDRILEYVEVVSPNLGDFAENQRRILQEQRVTGLRWKNVEDESADQMRPTAAKLLERVRRNLPAASKLINDNLVKMQQWARVADYAASGLLYRVDGRWIVDPVTPNSIAEGETLYCLIPGRRNVSSFEVIGTAAQGGVERGDAILPLQAGRPVFVIREKE